MIIKLLPVQVPSFWNDIKYAVEKVTELNDIGLQKYLTRLLTNLLSEKAFCLVRLDNERRLEGIFILRIARYEMTDEKALIIDCMYSLKRAPNKEYKEMVDKFYDLAKSLDCKYLTAWTENARVMELCNLVGFKETFRLYTKKVL